MAENKKPEGLIYKNHPLRRVDNFIYYGSMADKYIVLLQILDDGEITDSHGRVTDCSDTTFAPVPLNTGYASAC